jgi:hypothetical protein
LIGPLLHLKTAIILPRQARDKRTVTHSKNVPFFLQEAFQASIYFATVCFHCISGALLRVPLLPFRFILPRGALRLPRGSVKHAAVSFALVSLACVSGLVLSCIGSESGCNLT